jgi:hypothetical protein
MKYYPQKYSPIVLANSARYGEISWEYLTLEDLKEKDSFGETLLHHLIRLATISKHDKSQNFLKESKLNMIPKDLICDEILCQKNDKGESIYFCLAKAGHLDLIPQNLLTKQVLLEEKRDGETLLFELITKKQLELVAPNLIKAEILLEEYKHLKTTYLHICAMIGEIQKIPREVWIDKLGIKDFNNNNLLHWAADGVFEGYPINKETKKLMIAKNNQGETPLHKIRNLNDAPKEFLTTKNLLVTDNEGRTPLYWGAYRNPNSFLQLWEQRKNLENLKGLKEEHLLLKSNRGQTAIDHIFDKYDNQNDPKLKKIKDFLASLSIKTLETIKSQTINNKALNLVKEEILHKKISLKARAHQITIEF